MENWSFVHFCQLSAIFLHEVASFTDLLFCGLFAADFYLTFQTNSTLSPFEQLDHFFKKPLQAWPIFSFSRQKKSCENIFKTREKLWKYFQNKKKTVKIFPRQKKSFENISKTKEKLWKYFQDKRKAVKYFHDKRKVAKIFQVKRKAVKIFSKQEKKWENIFSSPIALDFSLVWPLSPWPECSFHGNSMKWRIILTRRS